MKNCASITIIVIQNFQLSKALDKHICDFKTQVDLKTLPKKLIYLMV